MGLARLQRSAPVDKMHVDFEHNPQRGMTRFRKQRAPAATATAQQEEEAKSEKKQDNQAVPADAPALKTRRAVLEKLGHQLVSFAPAYCPCILIQFRSCYCTSHCISRIRHMFESSIEQVVRKTVSCC